MKRAYPDIYYFLADWFLRRTTLAGVRRVAPLDAAIATDIGTVRSENQDRAAIIRGRDLAGESYIAVVVADGVGGMKSGAACASLALSAFIASLAEESRSSSGVPLQWMKRSIKIANDFVYSEFEGEGGSTLVAVVIRDNRRPCWVNVGDSRIYRVRKGGVVQISKDDTIAGYLGKNDDAFHEHSRLLQYVGIGQEMEPSLGEIDFLQDDKILLTTDGAHYTSSLSGLIEKIIGNSPDSGSCVKRLTEVAKWCGSTDNATAAMISLSESHAIKLSGRYDFVEIWDAYGELTYRQDFGQGKYLRAENFLPIRRVDHGAELGGIEKDAPVQVPIVTSAAAKTDRSGSRKTKTKKVKAKKAVVDEPIADAPQLLVEFPRKKD